MTICSRTKGYCFPYCFAIVLQSKNSKTGYQNANFFLKRVMKILKKNGHLPVKIDSSAPPPRAAREANPLHNLDNSSDNILQIIFKTDSF